MGNLRLFTSSNVLLCLGLTLLVVPRLLSFGDFEQAAVAVGLLFLFHSLLVYFYYYAEGDVTVKYLHQAYAENKGKLGGNPFFKHLWLNNHLIVAFIGAMLIIRSGV